MLPIGSSKKTLKSTNKKKKPRTEASIFTFRRSMQEHQRVKEDRSDDNSYMGIRDVRGAFQTLLCPWTLALCPSPTVKKGSCKVALKQGNQESSGHQVEHEPAVCPSHKECQQYPGLLQAKYCQQFERGDPFHLLSTGETTSELLCPDLGSSVQERCGHTEDSPEKSCNSDEEIGASLL